MRFSKKFPLEHTMAEAMGRIILNICAVLIFTVNNRVHSIPGKQLLKMEAENYWEDFIYRQAASQFKTVSMQENDVMTLPFCLRRTTTVSVNSVLYTNDGISNIIGVSIDRVDVGQITSHNISNKGKLWNVISTTGHFGKEMKLQAGPHKLRVHIVPPKSGSLRDPFGIEIDVVVLEVDDTDISNHYLHCFNTLCSDKISYSDRHRDRDDIPTGRIVQMSRPSNCLEEDNIKIPIYHEKVNQFRISALPPRYRTFWTFKDAQFDGCPEFSHYHWDYTGVECNLSGESRALRMSLLSYRPAVHPDQCQIVIKFDLHGMAYGKTDAHIGDVLTIGVDSNTGSEIIVKPKYGIRQGEAVSYTHINPVILNRLNPESTWEIPDFTWAEMNEDSVHLNEIVVEVPNGTVLNYIRLRRRDERAEKITDIYYNKQIKIQSIEFDYWWRDPAIESGKEDDMKIFVKKMDGDEYKGTAHYVRFIEKRVWAPDGDMDQTFVLYQDGSSRILPIVPHGLESYVPFGNDIVIGQADPSHMRPHAPIKKLVIKPVDHKVDIYYQDGGFANLHLFSSVDETNVTLSNITFSKDQRTHPFVTFRSTWVEDGRAKVDHVSINGLPGHHILLDKWTSLYGTTFVFFRKCISIYNSQSPDYSVEVLSDSELHV